MFGLSKRFLATTALGMALLFDPQATQATTIAQYDQIPQNQRSGVLKEIINKVSNELTESLLSDKNLKGEPKSAKVIERDRRRAGLVNEVLKTWDTGVLAIRIEAAAKENPAIHVENVIGSYIIEQIKKMEVQPAVTSSSPKPAPSPSGGGG